MNQSKMKKLPYALALAFGTGATAIVLSGNASAQTPAVQAEPQKIEKIEVTGSNIKRIDAETVAPVQIVTREDIKASGRSTIADVLRDLAINQGNGFNEQSVNSFSPGTSGISLRGLGAKNTLVLVNGRRTAGYGFAQNISDSFVDINSIPTSAVDRIEILKSGASHIYGSDAIAGVVNIILRKDYKGLELGVGGGTSTEGGANEYSTNLAAGIGDLARDRYNVLATVDFYKRDLLLQTQRKFSRENDYREYLAGDFVRPGIAVYLPLGAIGAAPNPNRIAIPGCTGQVLTVQQINPFTTLRGTNCVQNFAQWNTLLPKTERIGVLSRGTLDISSNIQAFAEVGFSQNKTFQTFQPPFIGQSNTFFDPATGLPRAIVSFVPATSPYAYRLNGTPVLSTIQYVFTELGGRDTEIKNDTARFVGGVKGAFGKWDYETGVAFAENKVTSTGRNVLLAAPTIAVLNNNTYNFFNRNDPANAAVVRGLVTNIVRKSKSSLLAFDARASTELIQTANGPIGLAVGLETRKEKANETPDVRQRDGSVFGAGSTLVDGQRRNTAAFVEVNGNVLKGVEVQAAVRQEHYSDFGSKTVPGIGAKWSITPDFLVRGKFSKGFRAPTLPENSKSNALFFISVTDPVLRETYQTSGAYTGNGNLKPETSDNYSWGAVWQATKDTSLGIDFYRIKQKDIVAVDDFNFILNNPTLYPGQVVRNSENRVVSINARYVNLSLTKTSGFDVDLRHKLSLGEMGKLTLAANYAYISSYQQVLAAGADPIEGVDSNELGTLPRYRGTISGIWEKADWTVRLANRHIEGYDQAGVTSLPQQAYVGARDFQDLFVSYTGVKNLTVSASVINLLDARPPFDGNAGLRFATSQYDLRGRYVNLGVSYKFK
jgi:iron complex outermembrane recepter protein